MQLTVLRCPPRLFIGKEGISVFRSHRRITETLPYVGDSLLGRMDHVLGVETIVTKFVEKNLISGEILYGR